MKLSRSVGCGRFYCYCAIVHWFSIVYQNKRQQKNCSISNHVHRVKNGI